jgi:hypothetical protein
MTPGRDGHLQPGFCNASDVMLKVTSQLNFAYNQTLPTVDERDNGTLHRLLVRIRVRALV